MNNAIHPAPKNAAKKVKIHIKAKWCLCGHRFFHWKTYCGKSANDVLAASHESFADLSAKHSPCARCVSLAAKAVR